jgi:TfoX/Sxy family transcriptional regulator of competence genes
MDEKQLDTIRTMEVALGAALAVVEPDAHISWKSMFGGAGFYADGVMFAAWFGKGLALKLPEDERGKLLQIDGAIQSQSAQYVEVPPRFLDYPHLLEPWVARSVDYVRTPKPRKRSSKERA